MHTRAQLRNAEAEADANMQSTFANNAEDNDDDDGIAMSTPLSPETNAVSAPEAAYISEPNVTTAAPLSRIAVLPSRRNASTFAQKCTVWHQSS